MKTSTHEAVRVLARKLGLPSRRPAHTPIDHFFPRWLVVIVEARERARSVRAHRRALRAARTIAASAELQAALETVDRLGDTAAVTRFLAAHDEPDLDEAEVVRRLKGRRDALVARRATHAREMLRNHEAALAREEKLVARWRKRVAYYDDKGV